MSIWCWLVSLISAFLVGHIGRRQLFLFAGVGMLASSQYGINARLSSQKLDRAVPRDSRISHGVLFFFHGTADTA